MPSFQPQRNMAQQRAAYWNHALRRMVFVAASTSTSLLGRDGTTSSMVTMTPFFSSDPGDMGVNFFSSGE